MGSLSLRKYVSHDHGKGPRACQLGIHQGTCISQRAVLVSRHAGCGGAVHGGARTFHGLYIAYAARVDRRLVPETQPRHKARTGITKYMPRGPVLPAWTLAMVGGARSHRGHCCSLPRHHTSPGTDTGPMTHPWDTLLCNKSRHFILSRPRGAAAAQRNGPCEMQDSGARTLSGVSQPFLGDG